jgi:hypothetical protein
MAGDHVEVGIDQHRHIETEHTDADRDLPDLLRRVQARILVEPQLIDGPILNRELAIRSSWKFGPGCDLGDVRSTGHSPPLEIGCGFQN